jgi:hypothetical protein
VRIQGPVCCDAPVHNAATRSEFARTKSRSCITSNLVISSHRRDPAPCGKVVGICEAGRPAGRVVFGVAVLSGCWQARGRTGGGRTVALRSHRATAFGTRSFQVVLRGRRAVSRQARASRRKAEQALRRLDLAGEMVASLDCFIDAFVAKQAVSASQIKGSQASLADLLALRSRNSRNPTPMSERLRPIPNPLSMRVTSSHRSAACHFTGGS